MNKDRKDQDVPNRQSNMEQAEGSRRNSQDDLDRDIDRSDMGSRMGSKDERGFGSEGLGHAARSLTEALVAAGARALATPRR